MDFKHERISVERLLENWNNSSLKRAQEYQRGEDWDQTQQRALIDSLFRRYPIPPLFIYKNNTIQGLEGGIAGSYEIVDGQQRLIALSNFRKGYFDLFEIKDQKFKVPESLRNVEVPWGGKFYDDLLPDLQTSFNSFELDVQIIDKVDNSDEIRDLFIRLQSGTALTPQQVRDAWPGTVGPFVERLAGKLKKKPSIGLFELIDRRGSKSEDEDQKDQYVEHRSTCAQLLRTFIARRLDPQRFLSISSKHLDALYHEHPNFETTGELAKQFIEVLHLVEDILKIATGCQPSSSGQAKRKFRKVDVICLMAYLQDIQAQESTRLDGAGKRKLAEFLAGNESVGGKTTSGASLIQHYESFRSRLPDSIAIRLDPKRSFDEDQQHQIKLRDGGKCQICQKPVIDNDEEYDHFPIAYARGGKTLPENGRLVHKLCHPRHGRLPTE